MSYSLQRYEGGNTAALGAVSDTARNVGSVFALRRVEDLALRRGRATAPTTRATTTWRARRCSARACPRRSRRPSRGACARRRRATSARRARKNSCRRSTRGVSAAAAHVLADLEGGHAHAGACRTTRSAVERVMNGATHRRARVRAAHRQSDRDGVRPAPQRSAASTLGHYYVGVGRRCDGARRLASRSRTRSRRTSAARSTIRSSTADWTGRPAPVEYAVLTRVGAVGGASATRAHSRRDDVARNGDSVLGDARRRALQVEQRVRRRHARSRRSRRSARVSICRSPRRCRS